MLIAQREHEGNPIGSKLKLNVGIKEKSLKQKLDLKYLECAKPSNTKFYPGEYKLYTLKGTGIFYQQINIIWLLTCGWVLSNVLEDENSGDGEEWTNCEDVANNTVSELQRKEVHEEGRYGHWH